MHTITLRNKENSVLLTISPFGGQIVKGSIRGDEVIFLSEKTALDGPLPIRGGAPVCFPHFGKGTMMPDGEERKPSHGEVRIATWNVTERDSSKVTLELPSSKITKNLETKIQYEALEDEIFAHWSINNHTSEAITFQAAFHSYFRVSHVKDVKIKNLNAEYLDNLFGLSKKSDSPDVFCCEQTPIDRVYLVPNTQIEISDAHRTIHLTHQGFFNSVVWNPGEHHTLSDLSSWRDFICVESCAVTPAPLIKPHSAWSGSMKIGLS